MFWKRRFPRLSRKFQISYKLVDQEKFDKDPVRSLALNISGGGVCFEATETLQAGALVALDIHSHDFDAPILALAKVVWCKPRGSRYQVGAEFWWVGWGDNQAQTTIANYVAAQTTLTSTSVPE
jgi:hypothetical protein